MNSDDRIRWLDRDPDGRTPLMRLLALGAPEPLVSKALAQGADVRLVDHRGRTALHHACLATKPNFGFTGVVSALLQAGADPQTLDDQGRTPLMAAFAEGTLEMKLLWILSSRLLRPLDPETRDCNGKTLLDYSADSKSDLVRRQLNIEFWARLSPHPWTLQNTADLAAWAPLEVLQRAVEETGFSVTSAINGDPILTMAVRNNDLKVVPWLVKMGAPLEALDNEGLTPLARAARLGMDGKDQQIHLLHAGADWAVRDRKGSTPFHSAVRTLNRDLIRSFLNSGAQAHLPDHEGETPLSLLCRFNADSELVRLLIRSIPVTHRREAVGQALVVAAKSTTKPDTVRALLVTRCVPPNSGWLKDARSFLRENPFLASVECIIAEGDVHRCPTGLPPIE